MAELSSLSDKVVACMRSSVQGPVDSAAFCSAWLYVLSCFQYNDAEAGSEQPSAVAVRLAQDYVRGIADKVKALLLRLSEVWLLLRLLPQCMCRMHQLQGICVLGLLLVHNALPKTLHKH